MVNSNKSSLSVREIFEDYIDKFHYIYFKNIGNILADYTISQFNKNYFQKLSVFNETQNKLMEIEVVKMDLGKATVIQVRFMPMESKYSLKKL